MEEGGGKRGLLKSEQGPPVLLTFLGKPPGAGPALDMLRLIRGGEA